MREDDGLLPYKNIDIRKKESYRGRDKIAEKQP